MGLSFAIAAGPRQRSHSHVRVPQDSWQYFTVLDSILSQPGAPGPRIYIPQEEGGPVFYPRNRVPFSSPSTAGRATVEVFEPASTRASDLLAPVVFKITPRHGPRRNIPVSNSTPIVARRFVAAGTCLRSRCLETGLVYLPISWSSHSNGCIYYKIFHLLTFSSNKTRRTDDNTRETVQLADIAHIWGSLGISEQQQLLP
jgi:hypothetical protein